MRAKTLAALVALVLTAMIGGRVAYADAKADLGNKIKAAMKAYDAFEYEAAKKLLTQAIATAKKAKLDKDPVLAKAHLNLGIVMFAVPDVEAAKASFRSAVQIDPNIQLDPAYKSPELAKLFDRTVIEVLAEAEPRAAAPAPSGAQARLEPPTGCAAVRGIEHSIIHDATKGSAISVEAQVGAELAISKVSVMYRTDGQADFTELVLAKRRDCVYAAAIPASVLKGASLSYYIVAFASGRVPAATNGSAALPHVVAITGTAVDKPAEADSAKSHTSDTSSHSVRVAVAGGAGLGYLRGTTEAGNTVTRCCVGISPVVATAEVAYLLSQKLSIGGVLRFGALIGANTEGHPRAAFSGLGRVRYAFSATGSGFYVMAQAGFGVVRQTIKLAEPIFAATRDVVTQGPLLVGGGAGASLKLTDRFALIAELSTLVGIAVSDRLGKARTNSGVAADLTLGVALSL